MRVLLAFLLIVIAGSIWESQRDRPQRALPLMVLCTGVTLVLFGVSRFV